MRCARRFDDGLWVRDADGLEFDDLRWTQQPLPDLPRFVPQVDGHRLRAFDEGLSWPAYAVGLRRVFSLQTGKLRRAWQRRTAREVLRAPDTTKLILAGYGTDPLIERFWTNLGGDGIFQMRLYFVDWFGAMAEKILDLPAAFIAFGLGMTLLIAFDGVQRDKARKPLLF